MLFFLCYVWIIVLIFEAKDGLQTNQMKPKGRKKGRRKSHEMIFQHGTTDSTCMHVVCIGGWGLLTPIGWRSFVSEHFFYFLPFINWLKWSDGPFFLVGIGRRDPVFTKMMWYIKFQLVLEIVQQSCATLLIALRIFPVSKTQGIHLFYLKRFKSHALSGL